MELRGGASFRSSHLSLLLGGKGIGCDVIRVKLGTTQGRRGKKGKESKLEWIRFHIPRIGRGRAIGIINLKPLTVSHLKKLQ